MPLGEPDTADHKLPGLMIWIWCRGAIPTATDTITLVNTSRPHARTAAPSPRDQTRPDPDAGVQIPSRVLSRLVGEKGDKKLLLSRIIKEGTRAGAPFPDQ
jgi:hypothetical protein